MALLTRTRPRAERAGTTAAEAIDRARDVAAPTVARAREATAPTVERAREAAAPTVERAREAAAPTVERARDAAAPTFERAREASRPALAQLRSGIGSLLRAILRIAALVPGVGANVLQGVATMMGRIADTSAQIAHVEPPSKVARRRSRRRAGLWFAGGFVTGAAAGYAAHEMLARDHAAAHDAEPEATWPPAGHREQAPTAQVPG